MHTIYFIPGLGADERLFSRLRLDGYEKKFIHWVTPQEKETMPEYARRLAAQIDSKSNFSLVGVSFGGMLMMEMAKFLKPDKLVMIASARTPKEIPWNLMFFKYIPVYQWLSDPFIGWLSKFNKHRFGIFNAEEKQLFADMLLACPAGYLKGAMYMILHWKNTEIPQNLIRIHGDKDYLFPIRNVKDAIVIKGGTHFMPYHKAEEIEKILKEKLAL